MCGWPYQDAMHADRANLIMRYLSIRWSNLKTENTVATIRISRSFLWYAVNELMHTMQEQIDTCDARTKWCMWCKNFFFFFWYLDGHSNHIPWLNHGCKIECLHLIDLQTQLTRLKPDSTRPFCHVYMWVYITLVMNQADMMHCPTWTIFKEYSSIRFHN